MKEILQEQKEVERRKFNLLIFKAPEAVEDASNVVETHNYLLFKTQTPDTKRRWLHLENIK